jgi:hypothetical protein
MQLNSGRGWRAGRGSPHGARHGAQPETIYHREQQQRSRKVGAQITAHLCGRITVQNTHDRLVRHTNSAWCRTAPQVPHDRLVRHTNSAWKAGDSAEHCAQSQCRQIAKIATLIRRALQVPHGTLANQLRFGDYKLMAACPRMVPHGTAYSITNLLLR